MYNRYMLLFAGPYNRFRALRIIIFAFCTAGPLSIILCDDLFNRGRQEKLAAALLLCLSLLPGGFSRAGGSELFGRGALEKRIPASVWVVASFGKYLPRFPARSPGRESDGSTSFFLGKRRPQGAFALRNQVLYPDGAVTKIGLPDPVAGIALSVPEDDLKGRCSLLWKARIPGGEILLPLPDRSGRKGAGAVNRGLWGSSGISRRRGAVLRKRWQRRPF